MSVVVKGMQMPKPGHCNECDVWSFCWTEKPPYNMFKSTCPLVALPDKHGRLIDANEIPWNHGANGDVVVYPDTIAEMLTIVEAEDGS